MLGLHTVQPSQARRPQSSGKEAERAFGPPAPTSLCSQPACFNTNLAHPTDGVQETWGAPILPDVQQKAEGRGGLSGPCRARGPRRPAWERGVPPGPRRGWGGMCGGGVQGGVLGSLSLV